MDRWVSGTLKGMTCSRGVDILKQTKLNAYTDRLDCAWFQKLLKWDKIAIKVVHNLMLLRKARQSIFFFGKRLSGPLLLLKWSNTPLLLLKWPNT